MAYSSGGTDGGKNEQVILLLAESRDAGSIPLVLDRVGVSSVVCATAEEIGSEIDRGVGALLMEEEMLSPSIKECLVRTLDHQPPGRSCRSLSCCVLGRRQRFPGTRCSCRGMSPSSNGLCA